MKALERAGFFPAPGPYHGKLDTDPPTIRWGGPDTARVSVTSADIRAGVRHCCQSCAMALAMNRATGRRWLIGPLTAMLAGDYLVRILLPPEAVAWLEESKKPWNPPLRPVTFEVQYDAGKAVQS